MLYIWIASTPRGPFGLVMSMEDNLANPQSRSGCNPNRGAYNIVSKLPEPSLLKSQSILMLLSDDLY